MSDDAEILARRSARISPWVEMEVVEVRMPGVPGIEIYHGFRQDDVVNILAMRRDGLFAIVRQFRPIVGAWTLELPGGTIDGDETPEHAAAREVTEESGLVVEKVIRVMETYEVTARLTNRFFGFFALVSGEPASHEPGMSAQLVDGAALKAMAHAGQIALPSNLACMYMAGANAEVRALCEQAGHNTPPWL